MNFMQFSHQKGNFSALNLRLAYFVRSEMSKKSIIMLLGMNYTRLERKMLIILDFENGVLPTYLPLCTVNKINCDKSITMPNHCFETGLIVIELNFELDK